MSILDSYGMYRLVLIKFFIVLLIWPLSAHADEYPIKRIDLYVAYAPGGATDFQTRLLTDKELDKKYIGQRLYVRNMVGGGGKLAWEWFVTEAKKDGYTLAVYNVPHFIAQSIHCRTKYNVENLEPIANWSADPAVLVVNKHSKYRTVDQLIEDARNNPVTVSGAGLYVGHHIALLQFTQATGVKFKYVPTTGGVAALQYVLSAQVDAGFNNLSDAYRHKGYLNILAVADNERSSFLPDVPTFKELNIDVDDASKNYRGIMAPKGVPLDRIEYLADTLPLLIENATIQKEMKRNGVMVRVMRRDEVISLWQKQEAALRLLLARIAPSC